MSDDSLENDLDEGPEGGGADPKVWLYPLLAELGVTRFEASLSGSGDSGEIDDVVWFRGDQVIVPVGKDSPVETPDSGVVLRWLVSEAAIVRRGDPLCEVDPVEVRLDLEACRDRLASLDGGTAGAPQGSHDERDALGLRIRALETRAAQTVLTAPADGYVNAFAPAAATTGFTRGETLLTLTPLTDIDTILSKLTVDDGSFGTKTFLSELHGTLDRDASAAGNWSDGEGGSVFSTYDLIPQPGRIRLVDADYTPGEEYGDDEEEEDWEPQFADPDEEAADDVEP
jgi:hypothetical protein